MAWDLLGLELGKHSLYKFVVDYMVLLKGIWLPLQSVVSESKNTRRGKLKCHGSQGTRKFQGGCYISTQINFLHLVDTLLNHYPLTAAWSHVTVFWPIECRQCNVRHLYMECFFHRNLPHDSPPCHFIHHREQNGKLRGTKNTFCLIPVSPLSSLRYSVIHAL